MRTRTALLLLLLTIVSSRAGAAPGQDINALCEKYEPEFKAVEQWLNSHPPLKPGDAERENVLRRLDTAFLEPDAKYMPCAGEYFQNRMQDFAEDFRQHKVARGVAVWKLYNHAEIIRTKDITIAMDLIPGFDQVAVDAKMLEAIVEGVDVLLVTHVHGDHANPKIVQMFVERGKPVVAPTGMWQPGGSRPDVFKESGAPDSVKDGILYVRSAELRFKGVTVRSFAAFQKEEPNNVYLITTDEGQTVMHLGDLNSLLFQTNRTWYQKLKEKLHVDVLIPNCWSPDLRLMLKTVVPKVILSSHEHELGHPVSGRRPYSYVYGALGTLNTPFIVPAWGERYDWPVN